MRIVLQELNTALSLDIKVSELRGLSVLIASSDQLAAALALIQIDGIARRLFLCPPSMLGTSRTLWPLPRWTLSCPIGRRPISVLRALCVA